LGWGLDGVEMGVFPVIARPALIQLLNSTDDELIRRWNAGLAIAFLVGAALGGYLFGHLGDRIGRVRAMSLSVLTYSLGTGVAALANSPLQLVVLRFLAAMGMGGEWSLGVALVVETWPERWRPLLAGLIGAAVNVGYLVVAVVTLNIDAAANWRVVLGWCVLPALLTFFIRMKVPESNRWEKGAKPQAALKWKRNALIGALAVSPFLVAVWGAVQFTQLWAQQMTNDARAGSLVQIISALSAIVGSLSATVTLANISRRRSYFALSVLALGCAQYLFLAHDQFGASFLGGVALVGFISGVFTGWFALYLPELFPTSVRATGQGIAYNSGRIFAAIGVALTLNVRGNYPAVCALVSLAYVFGIIIAWWLPETAGRSLE
jgi:MFS family permease